MAETEIETEDQTPAKMPLYQSVIVKVVALIAVTAIVVAMVVTMLNRSAAKHMAFDAVSSSTAQIAQFLSAGLAGAVRFKDVEELDRATKEAIDSSNGTFSGIVVANAEGVVMQVQGVASDNLQALVQNAFEAKEARKSTDGLMVATPILNKKGDFAGIVAVSGDTTRALDFFAGESRQAMLVSLIVLGVTLGLCSWLVAMMFTRPLTIARNAMTEIEHQNFDVEIANLQRRDELGQISRQIDHFRDKLREAKANSRVTLFQSSAFSGSSVPMLMVSQRGAIVGENDAWQSLLQANAPTFAKVWPEFQDGSVRGQQIQDLQPHLDGEGGAFTDCSAMPFKTDFSLGELKFSVAASAILDDEDNFSGAILEVQNVTERRLNSGLLDAIRKKQGILELTPEGLVKNISDVARDQYGHEGDAMIDKNIADFSATSSEIMTDILARVARGESVQEKIHRVTATGAEICLDAFINPVLDHKGKVYRVIEISTDITEQEAEQARIAKKKQQDDLNQKQVVGDLRQALSAMAKGNLGQSLEDEFAEEYEQLRADFNATAHQLRDVINDISTVSQSITDGAREISQGSDELSQRTENQAATLEQTAAALDQITNSVKASAEGANHANEAVQGARSNAQEGGMVVLDAVSAMKEIESSSDKISQIIGVIDDIAFQTNLLALNAGVEAARAGEAGRGFAVVASEVRALAQRSSDAAREIQELILTSSEHVDKGVGLVSKTGDALNRIVDSVENISGLIADIATSTKEQSTGLAEINTGVVQLDDVTQQNAAMVEESTAASHAMRLEAEKLEELVGIFDGRKMAATKRPASLEAPEKQAVNATIANSTSDGHDNVARWQDF